jgi:glycosyltransferase involved in cell wall biosynthesis
VVNLAAVSESNNVQGQKTSEKPLVSVIVPTKNSGRTLTTCLGSIRNQTYPNVESIIVDNFSADGTKRIAENHAARTIEADAKRSEARNWGANVAVGEFVFFVDSDMELDPNVVEECVKRIREGYDAIIIPEISVGEGFWAKSKTLEKLCYVGDDLIEGTRFLRRSVFEALGGYDSELEAGEDWDLFNRIKKAGYGIARTKSFIMHHEGRLSLMDSVRKKQYYAKTIDRYIQKHPDIAKKQLTLFRPAFFRNWRKMVADPPHAFGLFIMKLCEFGVGWAVLIKGKNGKKGAHLKSVDYTKRHLEDRKIRLINHFLPSGPYRFLDLGCGTGIYLPLLSERGEAVGLDFSPKLCKLSKKRGFDVVMGDGMHLPFKNEAVHGIWASEILEHLSSLLVFEELERVATRCIIATIPNPFSSNYRADSSHKLRYTIFSLKAYFETRKNWKYRIVGLGMEWPSAPKGMKLPKIFKLLTFYLTFGMPWLAPTICIMGYKKSRKIV